MFYCVAYGGRRPKEGKRSKGFQAESEGEIMACCPDANPSEQMARNEAIRKMVDKMDINPGPMYEAALEDAMYYGHGLASISPWKIREYVEAETVYDSNNLDVSEILRGAEWPDNRKGIAWPEKIISSSICLLILYCLAALIPW